MPIFFYKFSKNFVTTAKLQFFWISGIFPTCLGCFLLANTADQNHVDLQRFTKPYFCGTQSLKRMCLWSRLRQDLNRLHSTQLQRRGCNTSNLRDWDPKYGKSWNQDQISGLHHYVICSGETNILCSKCNVHLCLCQRWSLKTHFCESQSQWFQVSAQSGKLQVSRLWILQRNSVAKF